MDVTPDTGQDAVKRPWVEDRWAFALCLLLPLAVVVCWFLFQVWLSYGSLEWVFGAAWFLGLLACGWSLGEIVWCCFNQHGKYAWVWALVLLGDVFSIAGIFAFFAIKMD